MNIKFENRCGCIDIGNRGGCIDIFVPDERDKEVFREKDRLSKFFIEAPKACIKVAVIGGKPEGEVIIKV